MHDNEFYKLLLEDFLDDQETSQDVIDRPAGKFTDDDNRSVYPYKLIVNVLWDDSFDDKWRNICLDVLLRRIESIFSQVRIFTDFEFKDVFLKSDTNYSTNPDPVTFTEKAMPEFFDAWRVLSQRYQYSNMNSAVLCRFSFLVKGFRETTRERFAEKIRQITKRLSNLSPNNKRGCGYAFYYNTGAEHLYDEKISRQRDSNDFSTNYPFCLEAIDDIYNKITGVEDEDNKITAGRRTYYRNIYDENLLEPIIKRAIKKAKQYSIVARLCKVNMPDRNNFMFDGNSTDNNKEWASLIIDAAPGVASIDVKNIEEWIIKEIMWYIDEEYVDLVNICFALKCMCKVTDKQEEEVVRQWKEKHPYDRMSHDDKKYIYTDGGRRKCTSNSCDTFSKKYIWRARHLELRNFRGDFDLLIGDKNGCLTKKPEQFSYPLHEWNELIENMREENSPIWKK